MFQKVPPDWREAIKHPPVKALAKIREFIENSTHHDRIAAMVGVGRLVVGENPSALFVISEMRNGDFSERLLALNSCHGSRDSDHILQSVTDKSETIRAVARRLICIYGTDDQIVDAFKQSAMQTHSRLLRQLRVANRFEPVDRILAELKDVDVQEFTALLPYASDEFVCAHWSDVEERCSAIDWSRLARNKREYCAQRALDLLSRTPEYEPRVVYIVNAVIAILSKCRLEETLSLIDNLMKICSLNQVRLNEAVRAFPDQVANICAAHEERANVNFYYAYTRLDPDVLLPIMRRYPPAYGIANILRKLPVVSRRVLYEGLESFWRADGMGVIDDGILEEMPRDIREKEARIHLAMESLMTNPQLRMKYVPFLPFDEVKEFVAAFITDPDAELRGVAWSALIGAVRYNRGELNYIVEEIEKRKREQDPVRQIIVQALSMLPPSVWKEQHLSGLSRVIDDALAARDLSQSSAHYFEMLVLQLVPFYPQWAAERLATIWKERGHAAVRAFQFRINESQARIIEPEIVEVLSRWNKKEYEGTVIRTASLFGFRLKHTNKIVSMLQDIVLNSSDISTPQQALNLIERFAPKALVELVPAMLKKDPSWGTVPAVHHCLLRYRQDLLTPYLGQITHRGKFNSGKNAVVPSLKRGLSRLSSNQLKLYAQSLNAMASDSDNRKWENAFVISHLALIPNCPVKYLSRFVEGPRIREHERDFALFALATLDEGQGLPVLINALNDPAKAGVAIYALRSSFIKMPASQAFQLLQDVPRSQITVAKEVVRLLGDIRSEEAFKELCAIAAQELHRDVRVAVVTALWSNLDREESWEILETFIDDVEDAVAFSVIRTPSSTLSAGGEKRLRDLLSKGLRHAAVRVRMKTLERLGYFPVGDPELILLDPIISALNSDAPEECRVAAYALVRMYGHNALSVFPKAANAVMSKRRNILKFVDHLEAAVIATRQKMMPASYATIAALGSDPLTLTLRARLAIASMPWGELAQWFKDMDEAGVLHSDALSEVANRLRDCRRTDVEQMLEVHELLRSSDSERLRRIALAALIARSSIVGWTADALDLLETFRNDRSPFIAEVAQFTLPAEEEALRVTQA